MSDQEAPCTRTIELTDVTKRSIEIEGCHVTSTSSVFGVVHQGDLVTHQGGEENYITHGMGPTQI